MRKLSEASHCQTAVTPLRSFCCTRAPKLVQHRPSSELSASEISPSPSASNSPGESGLMKNSCTASERTSVSW